MVLRVFATRLVNKSQVTRCPLNVLSKNVSTYATDLRGILAEKIINRQKTVNKLRKDCGNKVISEITVNQIYGGMRGVKGLVTETSSLDPEEGIRFRGLTIPDCQKQLPKADGGEEPLPEGAFWLLLTGDVPTDEQVKHISKQWTELSTAPSHVITMLNNFPKDLNPMAQFSSAITACSTESQFSKAYKEGVPKAMYWESTFEDAMSLTAKLPVIASTIYRNLYRDGESIGAIENDRDLSHNFTSMLGYEDPKFTELMRLYLTILSDHEGGNVTAHTTHLVGSTLSDPYLAYAAGMNGLAGPLHGSATQEVLAWLTKCQRELGTDASEDQVKKYVWKTLKSGHVIPGFGHAVLRKTDPRYIVQSVFGSKHLPHDPMFKLVSTIFKVVPPILTELGKVRNPWPNVDAHTGVLFQYYGMTEMQFYPVVIGVSRALGTMASLIWDRALSLPLERLKSATTDELRKLVLVT